MLIASFKYRNTWYRFLYSLIIVCIITVLISQIIYSLNIIPEVQGLLIFISINIASMLSVSCLLLAYIHYKSPHYTVRIEEEMIIVPRNFFIPDSHFIRFDDIIFEGLFQSNEKYKIIYNGGVVILQKAHLNSQEDWDKIVYCVKSEVS